MQVKKLSWDELQRRKKEGICFHCEEKYVPGHDCKSKARLFLLAGSDGTNDVEIQIEEEKVLQISLHALAGCDSSKTMRMQAVVGNYRLTVLVDSGSTHNFINSKVADKMSLLMEPIGPFHIKVANGDPLWCKSRYVDVAVTL